MAPFDKSLPLGANELGDGRVLFRVWGPRCKTVEVKLLAGRVPPQRVPMARDPWGYYTARLRGIKPGARYVYVLDGNKERPDPASRFQPAGVHGPSEVVCPSSFKWGDRGWKGIEKSALIFYEAHIGTWTSGGSFDAARKKIPHLKKLGITCLELMPVAQFPGTSNWGYDGVALFAVHNSYGGPDALKRLVNDCHRNGIAVCLDVVYNHLGPEGNYLRDYGPYFSNRYHTPWGDAVNYDWRDSQPVRDFIIRNALFWIHEYHIDILRLDAVHGIFDFSGKHILEELADRVAQVRRRFRRRIYLIAESDLNDTRILRSKRQGGYGIDAQWSDDFHHAVHSRLTGERYGPYRDFQGIRDIARVISGTFVYSGQYSVFRRRCYGRDARALPGEQFVVYTQNHDQVGNRPRGDRLSAALSFEAEKLSAALLLTVPYLPLIFMGQEFGETAPFPYFVSHSDPKLIEAVWRGRESEFSELGFRDRGPDPNSKSAFRSARLRWHRLRQRKHAFIFKLYRDLITMRKSLGIPARAEKAGCQVVCDEKAQWLAVKWPRRAAGRFGVLYSFAPGKREIRSPFGKTFREILNTESRVYGGGLSAARITHRKGRLTVHGMAAIAGSYS